MRSRRPLARLPFTLTLAFAVTLIAIPHAGAAKEGPGTRAVRKANETIAALLGKKVEAGSEEEQKLAAKVTTSVRDFLDIDVLGRRALVDHWDDLTAAQKQDYLALLRTLIEASYVSGLRANLEYQVVYTGESKKGDDLLVTTEIRTKRNGRPFTIAVDYVLVSSEGKLRAFDVVTDGVGLVENYRAQFNRIIDKEGFAGLLARMKKKSS